MWLLLLLITAVSVMAYVTNHQRFAILAIIFLGTGGFLLVPYWWFVSPIALAKPYDYAYVATMAILVINWRRLGDLARTHRVAKIAMIYLAFLCVDLVVSVLLFSYNPLQSLQMMRTFCWPLFLLLFLLVPQDKLLRIARDLFFVVTVTSLLYLLQPITGKTIINPGSEIYNPYVGSTDYVRYLSTPDFLIFFLLLTFATINMDPLRTGARIRYWLLFLTFNAVQVASMTRSAIVLTVLALIHLGRRFISSGAAILSILVFVGAVASALAASQHVRDRFSDGLDDVTSVLSGEFLNRHYRKEGNFSYRIAHMHERASYILGSPKRWPFGIGFIHEDSAQAAQLGFKVGLQSRLTGRIVQVDTGDIAWSVIVLKTGVLGTGLLLWFLFASYRSVAASSGRFALVYRTGLVYYLLTSFFSQTFASPNYVIPVMFFLALALQEKQEAAPLTAAGKRRRFALDKAL